MIDTSKYPPKDLEGDASSLALCDRYLTKPVDAATMLGVLDELLQDLQSKQGDWKARAKAATQEKSIDLKSVQELNKKIENHVRKPPQQDA
jgi:YesN/AraC family two-component response regulator